VTPPTSSPLVPSALSSGDALGRALFEQSPLSTVVYDAAGHVVLANAAFERLFGLRVAELPRSYTLLDDPQLEAQGVLPLARRAFAGEAVVLPPVRYEPAPQVGVTTSSWTQAHLYPLRDAAGAVTAVVLVHVDLTARVDAEEALRASEARLRVALEAGEMGAWEWGIGENVVRWSATLERIHGLAPGTFGGTLEDVLRGVHPDDRARVRAALESRADGDAYAIAHRIVRPDGTVRWVRLRGQLLRDAEGQPERLTGICTDVTVERRADEETRLLAEAGAVLASSLDHELTLATVARLAVPVLADYCIVDLLERPDGPVRRVATAHVDPARDGLLAEVRRFAPALESDGLVARTLRSGLPQLASPIANPTADASAQDRPEHVALLQRLAPEAALCVPLVARGVTVGSMLLVSAGSGRRYGPEDLPVATELARRAAMAVDNARLHQEALTARAASEHQAVELELQALQLQEQAAELEAHQLELAQQVASAEALSVELRATNGALERARRTAEAERASAEGAARDVAGILGSISDPFVVYDPAWRFRYVNAAARDVFVATGRAGGAQGLLGVVVWDAYPELVGSGTERAMRRAAAERVPVTFEEFYPERGTWSAVTCYPMPDGGLATTWRDVTARRQAEEAGHYLDRATAILASSLDYEATLAAVAQLIVPRLADWCSVDLVGAQGAIERMAVAHVDPEKVRWAHEIGRRYPHDPDAPTGVPHVIRTGQPELVPEITDEMLAAGIADPEYLALVRALGLRSILIVPLVAHGRTLGALSMIATASGRRYGEADLQLAMELARRAALAVDNARLHRASESARVQAETANRSKTDFLASMSHELRTPLNAIGGYTDLLLLGVRGPVTPEQQADLERIGRSQRHLLGVINDILNFARVEAGFVEYAMRPVRVAALMEEVEPLMLPQLATKSLAFACDPGPAGLAVHADPEKVRQILVNLLANAVKFTPAGGRVWMSAGAVADVVEVRVHDTGIGIPPDRVAAVFEPFVQVHRTLAKPIEGTGLGLAISRDLARGMGGDLRAESVPERGSTFVLTLARGTVDG
jgi:PAS domain S-box-containing protein